MIDTGQAFWLVIVQGITEFLPISSLGHLVPRLLGWPDQGLAFDVAIQIGTLLAVVIYLRRQFGAIVRGVCEGQAGFGGQLSRRTDRARYAACGADRRFDRPGACRVFATASGHHRDHSGVWSCCYFLPTSSGPNAAQRAISGGEAP